MNDLNEEQIKAVEHLEGPMLVRAGAGSGKTRVVTYRIASLINKGILPSDILAVTFTNKAANEMRERIESLTYKKILATTFHSLGARILRESITAFDKGFTPDFTIYDSDDSLKLIKHCLATLEHKEEKGIAKKLKVAISQAKNDLIAPKDLPPECTSPTDALFAKVYPLYQAKLQECNALDFDDLLYMTALLFEKKEVLEEYQNRFLFVLIDEYQDTNYAQYTLIKKLVAKHHNIFAVGDPDQSIYGWRGARYQNILQFDKDFPDAKIIQLEHNYRSSENILQAANALIQHNQERIEKNLWSTLGKGDLPSLYYAENEKEEAKFVVKTLLHKKTENSCNYEDIAIFYRTNAQSRTFEDVLLSQGIPYIIYGGLSFYQRLEIKDILAYLRLILSNTDYLSFARTVNIPKRKMGPSSIAKIQRYSEEREIPILKACAEIVENGSVLPPAQRSSLQEYLSIISSLRQKEKELSLSELIEAALDITNYLDHLKEDPESYEDRRENLGELIAKANEWQESSESPSLKTFLEELSLVSEVKHKDEKQSVKLMSLHNGKGLEFDLVFLTGMEEDLFPHLNCKDSNEGVEEERRLCYVGMTRAKKWLYFSSCHYRFIWGSLRFMRPSRFLSEIPSTYLHTISAKPPIMNNLSLETPQEHALKRGDRVSHKTFGKGVIEKIYQTSLGDTYDIYFETLGQKRSLVAKYAKLTKI